MLADWKLNPRHTSPLHQQLEERIRQHIEIGHLQPGDRLPPERDLMQMADISRATVRQALATLVVDGILERRQGSGTYVRAPLFEQSLAEVYSFSEQLQALGYALRDEVLACDTLPAPAEVATRLDLPANAPVIALRRLRYINITPLMLSQAYIPQVFCPDLAEVIAGQSLYRLLVNHYHIPIISATDVLAAHGADKATAESLNIATGTPIMFIERTARTLGERPLHLGYHYVRGDMCRFKSDLRSPASIVEVHPL